jgi:hypothetical protein
VYFKAIAADMDAQIILNLKFIIPDEILNDDSIILTMVKDSAFDGMLTTTITMAEIRGMQKDSSGRYVFSQPIASPEMGKNVYIQFIDSDTGEALYIHDYSNNTVTDELVRSVSDYAQLMLTKGNAKQKQLATAMLVYGGYSQIRFGVDADAPVYNLITELGLEIPSLENITADTIGATSFVGGSSIGITKTTESPTLDSAISHKVYFVLDAGCSIDDYTIVLTTINPDGTETTVPAEVIYEASRNRYYVLISNIASPYLDYMYNICFTHNTSGEVYEIETSIMCWVKSALEKSTDPKILNLARALYYFSNAANTFFGR